MAFNKIKNSSSLIKEASSRIKGNYWSAFLVVFVSGLITGALSGLSNLDSSVLGLGGSIASLLITAIITYGMYHAFSSLYYGQKVSVSMLFNKTQPFGRNLLLTILVPLFIGLWSCLFFIPGIIKSLSYSLSFQIANEHPEYSATQCITESRKLMDGHKATLFATQIKLYLLTIILVCAGMILFMQSFIELVNAVLADPSASIDPLKIIASPGLLIMLLGTVPALFVQPYYVMCEVCLYHDICDDFDTKAKEDLEKQEMEIDDLLK